MRLNKALICAVLICALSLPSFAEEGANAVPSATEAPSTPVPATEAPASPAPVTESPTQQPAEPTPGEATSMEPTEEPSNAPTEVPSTMPSEAPTEEPSQAPSDAPTVVPSQAPSTDPTEGPSQAPIQAPTNEPTPEPSATPRPQPGVEDGQISIQAEGEAQLIGDSWKFASLDPAAPLCFHWTCGEAATSYLIYTSDASGALRFISETSSNRVELSSTDYANGRFTIHVGALLSDGSYTWGSARFELEAQGGFGGGHGGFGGGRPGGGNISAMPEEEVGFRVTPGEALTSSHASGTKNSAAYTSSTIPSDGEAMYQLYLESTQSEITLDMGESAFFANRTDGKLTLTPESDGARWTLSVLAMRTLSQSGIERVVFELGNTRYSLSTCMEFSGASFAALRAQGYVSKDLALTISQRGVVVSIGANEYSIDESGALVPLGADSK